VGAPDVGDPRIRLKAGQVKGRTVIPLSKQPDSMQAWKIVIPTSKVDPEPRAHDGHEWLYVLSGQMRLVLGDRDWVLGPGRSQSSTRKSHIGSAAPAKRPPRY
jgi:mannose-6-phosphate isomerase-like protein (cupin superfamily)